MKTIRTRRLKRDKDGSYVIRSIDLTSKKKKKVSKAKVKHGADAPSGGLEALLPSFIGVTILACGVMAKMGFRGRATVAGIDLGTTNSVVCVQAPAKGVGEIDCIQDPLTGSAIVPSVVSFLEKAERPRKKPSSLLKDLFPDPSHVVVGSAAKHRIDTHPYHTLYHAKRVIGRPNSDPVIDTLREEVDFEIVSQQDEENPIAFQVMHDNSPLSITPSQVGSYVINHLMDITKDFLGHENVKSAVICVPAKFNAQQRKDTVEAFRRAGVSVARILDEPSAAALAYGLHKKPGVEYILVYDFGGGTLDVSLLHVTEGFADVMGIDGDDSLGGADFDAAIAKFLLERQSKALKQVTKALSHWKENQNDGVEDQLEKACPVLQEAPLCSVASMHTISEKMKIELSRNPEKNVEMKCYTTTTNVDDSMSMSDFCSSLRAVPLSISYQEYNRIVQPLFERAIDPITRLLDSLDMSPDEIDEVVMVGGTTQMPQIRKLVKQKMQADALNVHIDPDITVAYGAASVID